jgi:MYXO-CTERM domain-containing protein
MWWMAAAYAWDVNDVDWTWQAARVEEPFSLDAASFAGALPPDEVEAVFQRALDVWNAESDADIYVTYGGRVTGEPQGGGDDGVNVTEYGSSTWGAGLAVATIGSSGGRLNDCDISVRESNGYGDIDWHIGDAAAPADHFDLANTVTHELGHCLGLNHSDFDTAIMYAYNVDGTGEEARHLSDDDRAGIQHLYGAVSPELVVSDARLLTAPVDGEPVDVAVTVSNIGDGSAYFVTASVDGAAPVAVGHLGAPTPVGARVGADAVDVVFAWDADCSASEASFTVALTDRRGRSWSADVAVPVDCGASDTGNGETNETDGAPAGCGCASGGQASIVGALVGAALLGRRRRR